MIILDQTRCYLKSLRGSGFGAVMGPGYGRGPGSGPGLGPVAVSGKRRSGRGLRSCGVVGEGLGAVMGPG